MNEHPNTSTSLVTWGCSPVCPRPTAICGLTPGSWLPGQRLLLQGAAPHFLVAAAMGSRCQRWAKSKAAPTVVEDGTLMGDRPKVRYIWRLGAKGLWLPQENWYGRWKIHVRVSGLQVREVWEQPRIAMKSCSFVGFSCFLIVARPGVVRGYQAQIWNSKANSQEFDRERKVKKFFKAGLAIHKYIL